MKRKAKRLRKDKGCANCRFAEPNRQGRKAICTYPGKIEIKNGRCSVMEPQQCCFACGICIGPFYIEREAIPVGARILCGHCAAILWRQGYLALDSYTDIATARKLMPDGTVVGKREPVTQMKEALKW